MASLFQLFIAVLLLVNAVAILNEERFLRRVGLAHRPDMVGQRSMKAQIVNLMHAVRTLLRVPLVAINVVAIGLALLFGI